MKDSFAKATIIGASLCISLSGHAREVTDALGKAVKVSDHPVRIVTLAPSLGELVADLVGDSLERIVGVSDYTDYPPMLSKVKSVGSYAHFNLEAVAALKPDLVIATSDGNARDQIEHLRELHLPVVVVKTSSFSEIEQSMRIVSRAVDAEKTGEAMITRLKLGLENVSRRAAERRKSAKTEPRVLLELDWNPQIVVGNGTFLNEALLKIGATNIYADINKPYPKPSIEDAVRRDPDVILVLGMGKSMKSFEQAGRDWQRFPKMKAVRAGRVHVIQADPIMRPSLRILEGLSILERAVHGR